MYGMPMVDRLRVEAHEDGSALARAAAADVAALLRETVRTRGEGNVMFATGNSQLAFVDALVVLPDVPWGSLTLFHMDEYVGAGPDHPAGFRRWIRERIADRVPAQAVHYLDGLARPDAECERYAALLRTHPTDVCVLGIGENGHLAFNDPPVADFDDPRDVKVVALDDACRRQQVGEGHFASVDEVPTHAMTVTVPALLRARTVVAVVPELRKAVPVRDALLGPVTTACPASALRTARDARLYLDAESASLLPTALRTGPR
jgi:glucosamine-6-phosphate deaminase